jgi:hypothetical protein
MKPTTSRPKSEAHRTDASRRNSGSSAAATGGIPATEEDIGTEGAGTEPRDSTDDTSTQTKRAGASSKGPQRSKDARGTR